MSNNFGVNREGAWPSNNQQVTRRIVGHGREVQGM
jgi:hypothetical protein